MTDTDKEMNDEGQPQPAEEEQKDRTAQEASKDMANLAEGGKEKELDANKVQEAMRKLAASRKADMEARKKRERELASVSINRADIDVIVTEFLVDKRAAELRLRECNGDLKETLRSYL